MQCLEVSCAVRNIHTSLGAKGLTGTPSTKLYHAFGIFVQASLTATWLYEVLSTTMQQLDLPARMLQMRDTVYQMELLITDGLFVRNMQSKTRKIKIICKKFCISLVHLHIGEIYFIIHVKSEITHLIAYKVEFLNFSHKKFRLRVFVRNIISILVEQTGIVIVPDLKKCKRPCLCCVRRKGQTGKKFNKMEDGKIN